MTSEPITLTKERIHEMADEVIAQARAIPQHEWDRRSVDWPFSSDSVVVEVGGYKGRWAFQMAERYGCRLYVFEPQPWAYEICKHILGSRAVVLNYALGTHNGTHVMGKWGTDGCGFFDWGVEDDNLGEMRDAIPVLNAIGEIDLMLMNIEGYEHLLLPYLIDNLISLPRRLMVQFHNFSDRDTSSMDSIREYMGNWYTLEWDYGVTLSAWQRKNDESIRKSHI